MSDRIGGWNANAVSASNAVVTAHKAAVASKQHVLTGFDVSFTAAPASPVLVQIYEPDLSPNVPIWSGYVTGAYTSKTFDGLTVAPGQGVSIDVGAGGNSVTTRVNLQGVTR